MFCVYEGDHLTLLNVYNAFIRVRGSMGLYCLCSKAPPSPGGRGLGTRLGSLLSLFQGPSLSWGKAGDVASVSTVFVSRPLVHVA